MKPQPLPVAAAETDALPKEPNTKATVSRKQLRDVLDELKFEVVYLFMI